MEFFKSKFYIPGDSIVMNQVTCESIEQEKHNQLVRDMMMLHDASKSFAYSVLGRFCIQFPILTGYRLIHEVIEATWVEVTDLKYTRVRFSTKVEDGDFSDMYQRVFYHPRAELFVLLTKDVTTPDMNDYPPTSCLYSPYTVNQEVGFDMIIKDGSLVAWERPVVPEMTVLIQNNGRFSLRYCKLNPVSIDFDTMYPESFKEVSAKIVQKTNDETTAGLIILHGEPGTGKTNYLRWLTTQSKRRMVFIPPEMVTNLTSPEFVTFLMANRGLTLVVEDAESTLTPRMGSERSIVSTILNLTDGLLGDILQCQFICTFNTELTNIDSALLRPGRLLVRQEFRNLTTEESNKYLESVDSDERVTEPTSIAVLTNIKTMPTVSNASTKKTFGFNNN